MAKKYRSGSHGYARGAGGKRKWLPLILAALFVLACFLVARLGGRPLWLRLYRQLRISNSAAVQVPEGATAFHFIDVGQGDATLIESDGAFCLIDAGTRDSEEALVEYLHNAGADTIQLLVMTHPHADHIGGMEEVLRSCKVERVLLPDLEAVPYSSTTLQWVLAAIEEQNIPTVTAAVGQTYLIGQGSLTVMGTGLQLSEEERARLDEEDISAMINDTSLVTRFSDGNVSLLCSGDAEADEEKELLAQNPRLKSTVFQAGHHGSDSSNTEEFLQAIRPETVVVSCGRDNSYGHPHAGPLARFAEIGAQVYRTDQQGSVVLVYEGRAQSVYLLPQAA